MKLFFILFSLIEAGTIFSQEDGYPASSLDSVILKDPVTLQSNLKITNPRNKTIKSLVAPALLITYGFISLESGRLVSFDENIKKNIQKQYPYFHTKIDDYLQYAPAAIVYSLNAVGIKGENNFGDRTRIYLLSNIIMGITVQSLKAITKVPRPDGYGTNAFPSGHTATAFTAAVFLDKEYKNISPWYGILGYAMATTTGLLRMLNNVHWFRDIVAGAGFGILSPIVVYRIYPTIKKWLFKDKQTNTVIMPTFQNNSFGISLMTSFNK